jgi:hypothetical protein
LRGEAPFFLTPLLANTLLPRAGLFIRRATMRKFAEVATAVLAAIALLALMPAGTAQAIGSNATSYVASNGDDA